MEAQLSEANRLRAECEAGMERLKRSTAADVRRAGSARDLDLKEYSLELERERADKAFLQCEVVAVKKSLTDLEGERELWRAEQASMKQTIADLEHR